MTEITPEVLKHSILDALKYSLVRGPKYATREEWYTALAVAVRSLTIDHWQNFSAKLAGVDDRVVVYLSAEYLLGPHLANNLLNLGLTEAARRAIESLNADLQLALQSEEGQHKPFELSFDDLIASEEEPGLGNGGLGRLAACYMDSMATLQIPSLGYGIRYEFGIFDQRISRGWQVEITDQWLRNGNPWEIPRPQISYSVGFGGKTTSATDEAGRYRVYWRPARMVKGVAYDTLITGYRVPFANRLRLWKAESHDSFNFEAFNRGDYMRAVEEKVFSENISKVLYPNDEPQQGRELRLQQQYFFVSCSLQDMIRLHISRGSAIGNFHKCWVVQLNDTHPAVAVAELMRILLDLYYLPWEQAWEITRQTFAYTNHTLLPEALEKWDLGLFSRLLPRHTEILFELNRRFLDEVKERGADEVMARRLSLIDETPPKYIRMAHLAAAGSYRINGVAELHTELLKRDVLYDFAEIFPERFTNVTNGVTPRRWIAVSNPGLAKLITSRIGDQWVADLEAHIRRLEPLAEDAEFRAQWRRIARENKSRLAKLIELYGNVTVDPNTLFDVQAKRFHEYKRQHLNVLHIITLFKRLRRDPSLDLVPRTFLFAGKAAPGYRMAKLMIKLIHSVAGVVNEDPAVGGRIKVAFLPDYNVKHSQDVYPAADLSEQISTAGKEASGTGNMKFAMNGALTIGTLDGANIEIRRAVGPENFFLFGLTADQVRDLKSSGYRPRDYYESNPELRECLDMISSDVFSRSEPGLFAPMVDELLGYDPYMLLADYQSYVDCQERVSRAFLDTEAWTRMSILNCARTGRFSSDRSIREYCEKVWNVRI
ncbi:MAG: glycogen/starch/alpha-glucan phosphorylase [Bryobacterales bacterium]|nr:glycogen/starch/alpha-glucan phosphorylase [Bryobacterales bacterium]